MKAPCLNCKDRSLVCHSKCNRYKKYRNEIDSLKIKKEDLDFNEYLNDAVARMQSTRRSI